MSDATPIRLLVFSSLYPNAVQPRHGVFVEERLRHLVAGGRVSATVVAPVPWFPLRSERFGAYANYARVPAREERHGIEVLHPRYPVIPKFGMNVAPALMYRALLPFMRKLLAAGTACDVLDAHYFYPDGVAAARLGHALGKPVVVTARGNDITLVPDWPRPRRQILAAAAQAAAIVAVSRALRDRLVALGGPAEKITVLRNGVDLEMFRPLPRDVIRRELGVAGPTWLAVGHLIERKGVHLTLDALARTPDARLLIAGDGPDERALRAQVARLGLGARVRFLGAIAHAQLCRYYNAADALLLASSREGMPNVALEAMACGTPVIAAPFDGVRELLDAPGAGEIAGERSGAALAAAWLRLRARAPSRADTRANAECFGWAPVVAAQAGLYADVMGRTA